MTTDADPEALLLAGLTRLGVPQPRNVAAKLLDFGRLLLAENRRTNLTGARDLKSLVTAHFLDSLAPLALVEMRDPIVDVGSGAGLPGIPAAMVYSHCKFVLLEPRAKRADFLESAVAHLALANASVVRSSAQGPRAADLILGVGTVLMRALGRPASAFRLGMPLLKPGGTLLLYEGRASEPTSEQRRLVAKLGGELRVKRVVVPNLNAVRHAWIVRKRRAK